MAECDDEILIKETEHMEGVCGECSCTCQQDKDDLPPTPSTSSCHSDDFTLADDEADQKIEDEEAAGEQVASPPAEPQLPEGVTSLYLIHSGDVDGLDKYLVPVACPHTNQDQKQFCYACSDQTPHKKRTKSLDLIEDFLHA